MSLTLPSPSYPPIVPDVHWVGAIDWHLQQFHGYDTPHGTSYNSYLILDEHPTLIDTVAEPLRDDLISAVKALIPLEKIEYIIVNHLELDHSGSLKHIIPMIPNTTIIASKKGAAAMDAVLGDVPLGEHNEVKAVSTGDQICIGKRTLKFVETTMLHWPDSMMTYDVEDQILFSNDGFGQHLALTERYDDEVEEGAKEAFVDYTATILAPFAAVIRRCLPKLQELPLKMIAPAHGIIWRTPKSIEWAIEYYKKFSEGKHLLPKVLVTFDTMYGCTESMARAVEEGAVAQGASVTVIDIRKRGTTSVARHAFDAAAIAIGSPTLNSGVLPTVAGILHSLEHLTSVSGKAVLAFGSYGWAHMGQQHIQQELERAGGLPISDPIAHQWHITDECLLQCYKAGEILGKRACEVGSGHAFPQLNKHDVDSLSQETSHV